jgi:hypothetical protein
MSVKKPAKPAPEVHVHDLSKLRGTLKAIGGSMSDGWNNILANQTIRTLWFFENSDAYEIRRQRHAAVDALIGIAPRDELEGMVAAQLVACHNASMECYRRTMIGSRHSRAGGRISTRRTSSRGHMRRCSNLSIATVARALKRSRWSTSTSTRAVRPSSAMSRAGGGGFASKAKEQPHAIACKVFMVEETARVRVEIKPIPTSAAQVKSDALFVYEAGITLFSFLKAHKLLPPFPATPRPRWRKSREERKKRRERKLKGQ